MQIIDTIEQNTQVSLCACQGREIASFGSFACESQLMRPIHASDRIFCIIRMGNPNSSDQFYPPIATEHFLLLLHIHKKHQQCSQSVLFQTCTDFALAMTDLHPDKASH